MTLLLGGSTACADDTAAPKEGLGPQEVDDRAPASVPAASPAPVAAPATASVPAAAPPYPYPYMPPPYGYPPLPPPMRKVWYGWQTLIIVGISSVPLGLSPVLAPELIPFGAAGFVLGGPIVHWAHGRGGRGAAVLGMHVGATLVGALLGLGAECGIADACHGEFGALGMIFGGGFGLLTSNVIDIALLSSEERPSLPMARSRPPKPRFFALPTFDIRKDRAVFGVMGAF